MAAITLSFQNQTDQTQSNQISQLLLTSGARPVAKIDLTGSKEGIFQQNEFHCTSLKVSATTALYLSYTVIFTNGTSTEITLDRTFNFCHHREVTITLAGQAPSNLYITIK